MLQLCAIVIRVKFNTYLGNCIFLFVYFVSKVNKVIRSQPKRGDSIFGKSRSFFISKLAKKLPIYPDINVCFCWLCGPFGAQEFHDIFTQRSPSATFPSSVSCSFPSEGWRRPCWRRRCWKQQEEEEAVEEDRRSSVSLRSEREQWNLMWREFFYKKYVKAIFLASFKRKKPGVFISKRYACVKVLSPNYFLLQN